MSIVNDEVERKAEMDMTPMIDCVFLLMIFFVLVIDLSQQESRRPDPAEGSVRGRPTRTRRLSVPIVNIVQDGRVIYRQERAIRPSRRRQQLGAASVTFCIEWKDTVVTDTEPARRSPVEMSRSSTTRS